jgi:nucleoside-diphosphate-sugar epimerase
MTRRLKVLVTGASGFVGSNIVRYLAERNHSVVATRRSSKPDPLLADYLEDYSGNVKWVEADVYDREKVMSLADSHSFDGVIHVAFMTPGSTENEARRAMEILDSNIGGTVNVLELARKAGAKRFVFVSSSGLYPSTGDTTSPIGEESPSPYLNMTGFYRVTKISCEKIVERYSQLYPLEATAMRLPVMYGPMERPTNSRVNMGPVHRLLTLALTEGRNTIHVHGMDYAGDWTYVMDAAQGLAAGLTADKLSPVYNIASGVRYGLHEFLDAVNEIPRVGVDWVEVKDKEAADYAAPVHRMRGPLSIEKARIELGYNPVYSPKRGVVEYSEWWRGAAGKGLLE